MGGPGDGGGGTILEGEGRWWRGRRRLKGEG